MRNSSLRNFYLPVSSCLPLMILVGLFSSACATMTPEMCKDADWYQVGFVDGQMGHSKDRLDEHRNSCDEAKLDPIAWEEGRKKGLADYCTPRGAYNTGSLGMPWRDVCPQDPDLELNKNYLEGRKTYALKTERERVQKEMSEKRSRLENDRSVVADIAKAYSLLTGVSQTQKEEDRIEHLTDQIYAQDASAPPGPVAATRVSEKIEMNPLPLVQGTFSVVFASTIGFGAGHGIQGIYNRSGRKWTAIDAINLLSLSALAANCSSQSNVSIDAKIASSSGFCSSVAAPAMPVLGLGLFVSRIWQAVEVGRHAAHSYSPYSIGAMPRSDGGLVLATWAW